MSLSLGNSLSIGRQRGGPVTPAWAEGVDLWRDFVLNIGNLEITDTHASTIRAPDAAGTYDAFGANELVRTNLGMQTVPTRTSLLPGTDMASIVPVAPVSSGFVLVGSYGGMGTDAAGLTVAVVGTGIDRGLPYFDWRVQGDGAGGNYAQFFTFSIAAAIEPDDTTALSAFLHVIAGDLTNIPFISFGNNTTDDGGGYLATASYISIAGDLADGEEHFFETIGVHDNPAAASVAFSLYAGIQAGPIDFTLRIRGYQNELSAFATPLIPTPGSATVTVSGNQQRADVTGLDAGVAGFVQVDVLDAGSNYVRIAEIEKGGEETRISITHVDGNVWFEVWAAGNSEAGLNLGPWPSGLATIAFAAGPNYAMAKIVGGGTPSADTAVTYASGWNHFSLGGVGYYAGANTYQRTKKAALKFGAQSAGTFAAMLALAEEAAA